MKEQILLSVLVLLIVLANAHSLFGKNIPRSVWRLSFISSIAAGLVLGIILGPFPENLLVGGLASFGNIVFFLITRAIRDGQPM